jgi:uncharacterized delta-60 repeat protein
MPTSVSLPLHQQFGSESDCFVSFPKIFENDKRKIVSFMIAFEITRNQNCQPELPINKNTMKKIFAAVVSLFYLSIAAYGQVGTIDASFGASGAYTFPIVSGINSVEARNMVVLSNDQIIVSTDEQFSPFLHLGKLHKLTSNGSLDASFGTGGSMVVDDSTFGYSNVIQMPNGKILASWHKHTPNVSVLDDYPFLTMHNSDGSLVPNFGINGRLDLPASPSGGTIGSTLAADANNNLYVLYDYDNGEVIRSYTSTGAVNSAFGNAGALAFPNDGYTHMVYTPTSGGRLLVARYDANDDFAISQYLLSGQVDFTFGSAGYVTIPYLIANPQGQELNAIGLQSDGQLLVHLMEYDASQALSRVARITASGALDLTFNNNAQIQIALLTTQIFIGNKLIQQLDGKIILGGGNVDLNTGNTQKAFFRLNGNGTADNTFGTSGLLALGTFDNDGIRDVKLQSSGKIIGLVNNDLNTTPAYLIRLLNSLSIGILETSLTNDLGLYPNPVQSHFELQYGLKAPETMSIYLIDAQGRIVHSFQENKRENGAQRHSFSLPTSIASGTYTVSLRSASGASNLQIIVR